MHYAVWEYHKKLTSTFVYVSDTCLELYQNQQMSDDHKLFLTFWNMQNHTMNFPDIQTYFFYLSETSHSDVVGNMRVRMPWSHSEQQDILLCA